MKSKLIWIPVIIGLLIFPVGSAAASGSTVIFSDPGAISWQDALIPQTLRFTAPPATSEVSRDCVVASTAQKSVGGLLSSSQADYGSLKFSGLYAALTNPASTVSFVGGKPVRGDVSLPPASPECDSWITEGFISLEATKDAPSNAVVVSQDPNQTGVDLTWRLRMLPTTYTYGVWEQIPYPNNGNCKTEHAECAINNSGKPCCTGFICVPKNPRSGNGKCEVDPNMPPIWACVNHEINYQETFVNVTVKASLTTASRNWILGDLAKSYPGTTLKHPEWSFNATHPCIWEEDDCVWTHNEPRVPVVDPGLYELLVTGTTSGTEITEPRFFSLSGGFFGVWLVESTKTG